jgi:pSer/pThr/pTyr-binding forkhead associated (FHA) protein
MLQEPAEQPGVAYLVIHREPLPSKRVELWNECTTIGRSRDCDIFLEDVSVHRRQASILYTPDGYLLRDDHGSGDSFVNGRAVKQILLHDGDELRFGNTRLTFYAHEGTRPFQLASSRGKELHLARQTDPSITAIARLELGSRSGPLRSFDLLPEMTIGRSRDCDIFLEDLAVSRLHATIRQLADGSYELEDRRSATGTFVNGQRVTRCLLKEGDVVQIGNNRITFRLVSSS